jgi:cobalt/nickel transport system permease protein
MTAVLAGIASRWASSEPDGLNKVAQDEGFATTETEHGFGDSPVAGYEVKGVEDKGLSKGLSGLLGVGVTFAMGAGLFAVVRGRRKQEAGGET